MCLVLVFMLLHNNVEVIERVRRDKRISFTGGKQRRFEMLALAAQSNKMIFQ